MASISAGSGLISGIDYSTLLTNLVAIEKQPITALQTKEAAYQVNLTNYGSLQGALSSLNTAIGSLDTTDHFTGATATSADTAIYTATADNGATTGSYKITVHQLAQAHKLTTSALGKTESVGTGTLSIQVGSGTAMSVDVAAGSTITDVASAINAQKGDVTASTIYDGTNYYLTLTGKNTGEANTIKITVNDTGDSNNTDTNGLSRLAYEKGVTENSTITQTLEAKDSMVDVDSITSIKRATNTLSDVINGVTINLVKAHTTPATDSTTLTVSRDTSTISTAVNSFISAYNDVVDFLNTNMAYDADTKTAGSLLGDSTAQLVQRRLSSLVNGDYSGTGSIGSLSDLGITKDKEGKLSVAASTLSSKLQTKFDDVVGFFTQTTTGKQGLGVQMSAQLDGFLDATDGTIVAKQKGIQDTIDGIEDDITRMSARVSAYQTQMQTRFNALELVISQYKTTGDYLTQQITSLSNLSTAIANQ